MENLTALMTALQQLASSGETVEFEYGTKNANMKLDNVELWKKDNFSRIYLNFTDDREITDDMKMYFVVSGNTKDSVIETFYDNNDNEYPLYGKVIPGSQRKKSNIIEAVENLLLTAFVKI